MSLEGKRLDESVLVEFHVAVGQSSMSQAYLQEAVDRCA